MARALSETELAEAERLLAELVAPMFEERVEGLAFWAFYVEEQPGDLEPDEVLERFRRGRGAYAVEFVWDEELELQQRGQGRVVHDLDDLRALRRRAHELADGMEHTRRRLDSGLAHVAPPASAKAAGPGSWIAARTFPAKR